MHKVFSLIPTKIRGVLWRNRSFPPSSDEHPVVLVSHGMPKIIAAGLVR